MSGWKACTRAAITCTVVGCSPIPIGSTTGPGTELDGSLFGPENRCFACSPEHPTGFRLRFEIDRRVAGEEVVTRFLPGPAHEGAPGIMHGGLVTTLADEVGCWALIALLGKFGFTATMASRFPRPVRTARVVEGRAKIVRDAKRMIHVEVNITQEDAQCFASAMSFIVLTETGAEKILGGPLPPAWRRFVR